MQLHFLGTVDLTDHDARRTQSVLAQPKRLGLLAYLAAARPYGFHRRDSLLALFWPQLGPDQARRALRQALHFLRQALGDGAIVNRGVEDVAVSTDALWCDVRAFDQALNAGQHEDALSLYRGDLLRGFYVSGVSSQFDHWLDRERAWLREQALMAAWALAEAEDKQGNGSGATYWARRATDLHSTNEHSVRKLIEMLGRHGDRTGAMRAYENFAKRIERDYNVEPARETTALIRSVREQSR